MGRCRRDGKITKPDQRGCDNGDPNLCCECAHGAISGGGHDYGSRRSIGSYEYTGSSPGLIGANIGKIALGSCLAAFIIFLVSTDGNSPSPETASELNAQFEDLGAGTWRLESHSSREFFAPYKAADYDFVKYSSVGTNPIQILGTVHVYNSTETTTSAFEFGKKFVDESPYRMRGTVAAYSHTTGSSFTIEFRNELVWWTVTTDHPEAALREAWAEQVARSVFARS